MIFSFDFSRPSVTEHRLDGRLDPGESFTDSDADEIELESLLGIRKAPFLGRSRSNSQPSIGSWKIVAKACDVVGSCWV